jgi:hypothetical protein
MKRGLRLLVIGAAVGFVAFVVSMLYAGWKSRPQIPAEHAAH